MRALANIIRWTVFLPIVILFFYLVSIGFAYLVMFISALPTIVIILLVFVGIGLGFGLLSSLSMVLSATVLAIPPHKKAGSIVFSIVGSLIAIIMLIRIWNYPDGSVLQQIILSLLYVVLMGQVIFVGVFIVNE